MMNNDKGLDPTLDIHSNPAILLDFFRLQILHTARIARSVRWVQPSALGWALFFLWL